MIKNILLSSLALALSLGSLAARSDAYICSGNDAEREQLFELKVVGQTAEQDYEQWKIGRSSKRFKSTTTWTVVHNDQHALTLLETVELYDDAPELAAIPSLSLFARVFVLDKNTLKYVDDAVNPNTRPDEESVMRGTCKTVSR